MKNGCAASILIDHAVSTLYALTPSTSLHRLGRHQLKSRRTPEGNASLRLTSLPSRPANLPAHAPHGLDSAALLSAPDDLIALKPDLVIEAAGRAAISQWGPAALVAARAVIFASTSAFSDDGILTSLSDLAERHGSKIELPSGAIGGMDALTSAAILGLDDVVHQIVKPPDAWRGTAAEQVDQSRPPDGTHHLFSGARGRRLRPILRMPTRRSSRRWRASASTVPASK